MDRAKQNQVKEILNNVARNFDRIYKGISIQRDNPQTFAEKKRDLHNSLLLNVKAPLENLKETNPDDIHLINEMLSRNPLVKQLDKEGLRILSVYVRDAYVDEKLKNDLLERIENNKMNEQGIMSMISDLLGDSSEIEDISNLIEFINRAGVEASMEVLNWMYNYVRSGDAAKDGFRSLEDVFEKINERSLSPNPVFSKDRRTGKYTYNMALSGVVDSVYVNNNGEIFCSDTTYSKRVVIENDSFIRHAQDIYIVREMFQEKLMNLGPVTNDTIRVAAGEMRRTELNLWKERERFRTENPDWISKIGETTYSVVHNSADNLEEEDTLLMAYVSRIKNAYSDGGRVFISQVEEFLSGMDFMMVGSGRTLNLSEDSIQKKISSESEMFSHLERVIRGGFSQRNEGWDARKTNFINFMGTINYLVSSKRFSNENLARFLSSTRENGSLLESIIRQERFIKTNVGSESDYKNLCMNSLELIGLEEEIAQIEQKIQSQKKSGQAASRR